MIVQKGGTQEQEAYARAMMSHLTSRCDQRNVISEGDYMPEGGSRVRRRLRSHFSRLGRRDLEKSRMRP